MENYITDNTLRLSYGTAISLGLLKAKQICPPTTAYLLVDRGCKGGCVYCSRSNSNINSDKLSRILWPSFDISLVLKHFEKSFQKFKRICIQTSYNIESIYNAKIIFMNLKKYNIPISVTLHPAMLDFICEFLALGASHIGVGFDCATEITYQKYKKSNWHYDVESLFKFINQYKYKIEVHLIFGLGDTEKDFVYFIDKIYNNGGNVSLFAYTPINPITNEKKFDKYSIAEQVDLKQPDITSYRKIQLFSYLCKNNIINFSNCTFDQTGKIIAFGMTNKEIIKIINKSYGEAFKTSGCSDCNRPFYNERPGGVIYNYPRDLTSLEIIEVIKQLNLEV